MKGMFLAAGLGTRLKPLTEKIPKPAIPLLNVPMLLFNEFLLRDLDLSGIVVNTHHLPKQIRSLFDRFKCSRVHESHEAPQILGSGGGIWKAKKYLESEDHFIVCNGDNIVLPRESSVIQEFRDYHIRTGAIATLFLIEHEGVGRDFRGVWLNKDNRILDISKQSAGAQSRGYHFIGIQMFSKRIFNLLPEGESNIFDDVLIKAIKAGEKVMGFPNESLWFETGDEKSYLQASRSCLELLTGSGASIEKNFLISLLTTHTRGFHIPPLGQPLMGQNVRLSNTAKIDGVTVIGSHVSVLDNAEIRGSVLLDNVEIPSHTTIQNRIVF
jgi:mannose-1-phosphate guanylyltransferase